LLSLVDQSILVVCMFQENFLYEVVYFDNFSLRIIDGVKI